MNTAPNTAPTTDAAPAAVPAESIEMLRGHIDALDAALLSIVAERARVSRRIQAARMNAGGTRVELGRERTVRNTYRDAVGAEGPTLAEAVLAVCRGSR